MAAEANSRKSSPNEAKAKEYLNRVRRRAFGDDNHKITVSGTALTQAIWDERRLELAMEGERFFDLVRWGIAEEVMNEYYSDEQSRRNYYVGAHFSANKHEYLPIPEQQIKFSKYLYKQNVGY